MSRKVTLAVAFRAFEQDSAVREKAQKLSLGTGVAVLAFAAALFNSAWGVSNRVHNELSANPNTEDDQRSWNYILMPLVVVAILVVAMLVAAKIYFYQINSDEVSSEAGNRIKLLAGTIAGIAAALGTVFYPCTLVFRYFDRKRPGRDSPAGHSVSTWFWIWGGVFIAWGLIGVSNFFVYIKHQSPEDDDSDDGGGGQRERRREKDGSRRYLTPLIMKAITSVERLAVGASLMWVAKDVELRIDQRISASWTSILLPVFVTCAASTCAEFFSLPVVICPTTLELARDREARETAARKRQDSLGPADGDRKPNPITDKEIQVRYCVHHTRRCVWRSGLRVLRVFACLCLLAFAVSMAEYQEFRVYKAQGGGRGRRPPPGGFVVVWLYLLSATVALVGVVLVSFFFRADLLMSCARTSLDGGGLAELPEVCCCFRAEKPDAAVASKARDAEEAAPPYHLMSP